MEFHKFVFNLVRETSPIEVDTDDFAKLKYEIEQDWQGVVIDPEHEGFKKGWKSWVKGKTQDPYVRLGLSVLFMPLAKMIRDWYNGKFDKQDLSEDAVRQILEEYKSKNS